MLEKLLKKVTKKVTKNVDKNIDKHVDKGCQIMITCNDIELNGIDHKQLNKLLRKWDPLYYLYAFGVTLSEDTYLQLFVIFEEPRSAEEIHSDFGYADSIVITKQLPIDTRNDIILAGPFTSWKDPRKFLSSMAESGPCPTFTHISEDFYADEEEMFIMIEMGYTNEEIMQALPSTADHILEMDEYRQYYFGLHED